jgi:F-type H+-transporting ATPase subunit delta
MSQKNLIERYVNALMMAAKDQGIVLDRLVAPLQTLVALVDRSNDLGVVLTSPRYNRLAQERAVVAVLEAQKTAPLIVNWVKALVANRRGALVQRAALAALSAIELRAGRTQATVEVAGALATEQQNQLAATLSKWSGTKVALNVTVNPAVLGGMRVRYNDLQIDDTVAGKLTRLKQSLSRAASA